MPSCSAVRRACVPGFELVEGPGHGQGQMCGTHSFIDTLVSIDGMVFVRVAFELADCRPTAGEKVLTDTQRAGAAGCNDAKGGT